MTEGIQESARTIAVLSYAYLESVYGQSEWQAAYRADPRGFTRKLLPVRIEDCSRPALLGEVVSFDLFGLTVADARARLRNQIAVALAGRAKPPTEPTFPAASKGEAPPRSSGESRP